MNDYGISGFGGIFFRSDNPGETMAWYEKNLGLKTDGQYGANLEWRPSENPSSTAYSVWSPFGANTEYFEPSKKDFMVNFRVKNLGKLLEKLKADGIMPVGEMQEFEYGKFAWVMDPNGIKIELWEPNDESFSAMCGDKIHKT